MISFLLILSPILLLPLSYQTETPSLSAVLLDNQKEKKILHIRQLSLNLELENVDSLLSPAFSLWVRNSSNVTVHRTVSVPTCLYSGYYEGKDTRILASISTCNGDIFGTFELNGVHHIIEKEKRQKRDSYTDNLSDILVVKAPGGDHKCGLNSRNRKSLMVEDRPIVKLSVDKEARYKRDANLRYIEIAVFVDDKMYNNVDTNKKPGENTLQRIQDIVFTYLNAVQIIYQSERLANRLKLVLVRLDILQAPDSSLKNYKGDIERYLESFCGWQKLKNPGGVNVDLINDDHWDHALLLTGYNLFDTTPDKDSVIGLAWVSGMCTQDYSCTINEGNNFESVFVIAHEMGHNLGMNHDGEAGEGNSCNPNKFLMSPVLGPGKVSWSPCSDKELKSFLVDPKTREQASCLNDVPKGSTKNNFSLGEKKPGEKFAAIDQCKLAFGSAFTPYVKSDSPFEDLCRELWCSNSTHALRAHPALEGTDCSSKPYPYGSVCKEGVCSPFNPSQNEEPPQSSSSPSGTSKEPVYNTFNEIPAWYDPIFTKIFTNLRKTFQRTHPNLFLNTPSIGAKVSQMIEATSNNITVIGEPGVSNQTEDIFGVWQLKVLDCPVPCGGGWVTVEHQCQLSGLLVDPSNCDGNMEPTLSTLPCSTNPCNPS